MGLEYQLLEGRTAALTIRYEGNSAVIFANHTIRGVYHYPIATLHPLDSAHQFKEARQYLRNAQDWAQARATQSLRDLYDYHERREAGHLTPPQSSSIERPQQLSSPCGSTHFTTLEELLERHQRPLFRSGPQQPSSRERTQQSVSIDGARHSLSSEGSQQSVSFEGPS